MSEPYLNVQKIQRLERQLAIADVTGEAVIKERDQLQRELTTAIKERDEARDALPRPVYQILAELAETRAELDRAQRGRDDRLRESLLETQGFKDQNRRLVTDLEQTRTKLRDAVIELQLARHKVIEQAIGLEPESEILREKSARARAVEAVATAEAAAEEGDIRKSRAYTAIADAWVRVAQLPEKRIDG